jgi:hypothetical protein
MGVSRVEENLMQYFLTQGPFAVLFLFLLGWVLRENAKREERLINSLEKITDRLDQQAEHLNRLAYDVSEIKGRVGG